MVERGQSTSGVQPTASRPYIPGYGIPRSEKGMLPWSHVVERMQSARNYWIGTTDPQGLPHATPIWGVWVDDTFYFDGSPQTRRGRNLANNPGIVVHLENGSDVVILQGEAHQIFGAPLELRQKLSEAYSAKYKALGYDPPPETWAEGGLYRLTPRVAFAWTQFPKDTTRWKFD